MPKLTKKPFKFNKKQHRLEFLILHYADYLLDKYKTLGWPIGWVGVSSSTEDADLTDRDEKGDIYIKQKGIDLMESMVEEFSKCECGRDDCELCSYDY